MWFLLYERLKYKEQNKREMIGNRTGFMEMGRSLGMDKRRGKRKVKTGMCVKHHKECVYYALQPCITNTK